MKYFEDIEVGEVMEVGRHTFTAEDIKAFARRFDPQLFHVDEAAAARSHFGALCASGWHTAAVWMRLAIDARRRLIEAARARGEPIAATGPALGIRDLKWLKPVYADDTIEYRSEVVETRPSNSRPGFGLMTILSSGVNQNGEPVISFVSTTFVERRPDKP
jgi:acyl dehydratase